MDKLLLFVLIFTSQLSFSKEELKALPKKIELKEFRINKIEFKRNLKLKPFKLKQNLNFNHIPKKKVTIIESGYYVGDFERTLWGDYKHVELRVNSKLKSVWCKNDCEKLDKVKPGQSILILWKKVKNFIPEANEEIVRIETEQIHIAPKIHTCKKVKDLPLLVEGCEGEACGVLKYNRSIKNVDVYSDAKLKSKTIGKLNQCDLIKGFKSYISIQKLGLALITNVNKKKTNAEKGQFIYIRNDVGEGIYEACIGDQIKYVSEFDIKDFGIQVKSLRFPKTQAWSQVKLETGLIGYINNETNFYIGYYGDIPKNLCSKEAKNENI